MAAKTWRQYTKCVEEHAFDGQPFPSSVAAGFFVSLTALVVAMLATKSIHILMGLSAAAILITVSLLALVHWWLYGRLICLGEDACVVGMVLSVEPPWEKQGSLEEFFNRLDSDYSFNLLLPPLLPGATEADVVAHGIQGRLIQQQPMTKQHGYREGGYKAHSCDEDKCGAANCPRTVALHCEFEGAGMYILYLWLKALLAVLLITMVLAALCTVSGIWALACTIAWILLASFVPALGLAVWHGRSDEAYPSDVNPALGSNLHTNECSGTGADLLVVKGAWVYDSLHEGWNELHPVKFCEWIGEWNGTWPVGNMAPLRDAWCEAIEESGSALTVANQQEPHNQWRIHPVVDGCRPTEDDDDDYEPR